MKKAMQKNSETSWTYNFIRLLVYQICIFEKKDEV